MTDDEAESLSILLLQIIGKLDQSASFVRDRDDKANWGTYRQSVGQAMASISLDLAEPLWGRFPKLRPEYLGGPYKVDQQIYRPYFYEPR